MKIKEPIAKLKKNEQSMSGRNAKSKKKSVKKIIPKTCQNTRTIV